ncbi:hypothetical protein [Botryobacter ruber]|uniref:hypothetical protein n=1 Tax=Botryobacter ruber TaxID=2171629 RepID=UPI000E0C8168|nr:hypothetical protein [Botryobacter ruber]
MLHHLTWTQFFLATGTSLLLYYLIVTLLCYRQELKALVEKATARLLPQVFLTSSTPETAQPGILAESTPPTIPTDSPIGAVSTQDAPTVSDAFELQVAPRTQGEEEEDDMEETDSAILSVKTTSATEPPIFPMGTLADLLEEIKPLLELVAETQLEKVEFISLLQLIISRYSRTAQSQHQDQVQQFLLEQSQVKLPYELTPEDLQVLWPKS